MRRQLARILILTGVVCILLAFCMDAKNEYTAYGKGPMGFPIGLFA